MDTFTINYIHFCDAATIDIAGKINILGIFNRLLLPEIPYRFPKFTLVINANFKNFISTKNSLAIKIFSPNGKLLDINPPILLDLPKNIGATQKDEDINLLLDIANLEFKEFGKQKLVIYLNEKEVGSKFLLVEKKTIN